MDGNHHAERLGRELMRRQRSGEKLEAGAGKKLIDEAIEAEELEKKCKGLNLVLGEARLLLTVRKYDQAVERIIEAIQLPLLTESKPAGKPSGGPGGSPITKTAGTANTNGRPAIPGHPAPTTTPGASQKR